MKFFARHVSLFLTLLAAAAAATTEVSTDRPIINFRSSTFTAEGFRAMLLRGSQAQMLPAKNQIMIKELTLSVFPGKADNEKVETMILSPSAEVHTAEGMVIGPDTIRVINDQFEATGTGWSYSHKEKRVSIARNVRVTFRAELKDVLK